MTTVDPNRALLDAMRSQLQGLRERSVARSSGGAPAQAARRKPHTLSLAMAQRIQAIPPDEPDRPRKAVRVVLEAEIAREFGPRLLNDPGFAEMLDAVQQQMEQDAQLAAAVESLGRLLLAGRIAPS